MNNLHQSYNSPKQKLDLLIDREFVRKVLGRLWGYVGTIFGQVWGTCLRGCLRDAERLFDSVREGA